MLVTMAAGNVTIFESAEQAAKTSRRRWEVWKQYGGGGRERARRLRQREKKTRGKETGEANEEEAEAADCG